jgi:hypothetical protein
VDFFCSCNTLSALQLAAPGVFRFVEVNTLERLGAGVRAKEQGVVIVRFFVAKTKKAHRGRQGPSIPRRAVTLRSDDMQRLRIVFEPQTTR